MAFQGTWNTASPPNRAGVFLNVSSVASAILRDAFEGTTALVVKADWGPDNTIVEIDSEAAATATYHTGQTAEFCIRHALLGEGIEGRFGAKKVAAYRVTGSARAKAAVTLQNTTPANALTVTAKYNGTRGNNFRATVQVNPLNGALKDLIILEGTTVLETWTHTPTDITALAASINAGSNYVTATMLITGVALANISQTPLTGGNSGTALVLADHTTAQSAFESYALFDTFAVDDLPDDTSSIRSSYRDWIKRINTEGKLCHFVTGGLAAESLATATTRATDLNSEYIVTLTGDVVLEGAARTSSQIACKVAGIISGAGISRSISGSRLNGATMSTPPTTATIEALVTGGVVPIYSDGGVIRLQRGKTTYLTSTGTLNPKFKSLVFMRRLQYTFKRFDLIAQTNIIGQPISNTPSSRENILNMFRAELKLLEEQGTTIPGATVQLDPSEDNTGESIFILFSYEPAPGIEQILGTVSIPTT